MRFHRLLLIMCVAVVWGCEQRAVRDAERKTEELQKQSIQRVNDEIRRRLEAGEYSNIGEKAYLETSFANYQRFLDGEIDFKLMKTNAELFDNVTKRAGIPTIDAFSGEY